MDIINFIVGNWSVILEAVIGIVGVFSLISVATPNKADDAIVQKILEVINFLGANVGRAKNDPKV